jgi:septum formation protein
MQSAENKIYLASKSPRRRELLRQIGVDFELQLRSDGRRGMDVTEEVLRAKPRSVCGARGA